jgi:acetolactate decarboxylase
VLALVDQKAGGADKVVALRLDGPLASLKARSVGAQSRPYRSLAEVIKTDQATFDLAAITGSAVGFRFPASATGANVPGWHLHFMGDGKGGHVFGFTTGVGVTAHVQILDGIRATFPSEAQSGHDAALDAVEKGRR